MHTRKMYTLILKIHYKYILFDQIIINTYTQCIMKMQAYYNLSLGAVYFWMVMIIITTSCSLFESTNGTAPAYSINVAHYGARSDGKSEASKAFMKAWSTACHSGRPAVTMYVPRGLYILKNVVFTGPCRSTIVFQIDGTLLAPSNYWELGSSGFWILFHRVNRMSIHGGTIDARAHSFWACRKSPNNNCPPGARVGHFSNLTKLGTLIYLIR